MENEEYNLLILDDGLLSTMESALTTAIFRKMESIYGKYLNVAFAKDIQEAIEIINKIKAIHVLVTDMNLPSFGIPEDLLTKYRHGKFGGIYVIDELTKLYPNSKVIISSAWNPEEYKHLLKEREEIILQKPYLMSNLEESIDYALQKVIAEETKNSWNSKRND